MPEIGMFEFSDRLERARAAICPGVLTLLSPEPVEGTTYACSLGGHDLSVMWMIMQQAVALSEYADVTPLGYTLTRGPGGNSTITIHFERKFDA